MHRKEPLDPAYYMLWTDVYVQGSMIGKYTWIEAKHGLFVAKSILGSTSLLFDTNNLFITAKYRNGTLALKKILIFLSQATLQNNYCATERSTEFVCHFLHPKPYLHTGVKILR